MGVGMGKGFMVVEREKVERNNGYSGDGFSLSFFRYFVICILLS